MSDINEYLTGKLSEAFDARIDETLSDMFGPTTATSVSEVGAYKIAATMHVPLSMLLDVGDMSPATMRMAEADGRWWEIGQHYNRWPKIDPLPAKLSKAYDWCEAVLLRVDDAIGVLRWGLPEPRDW